MRNFLARPASYVAGSMVVPGDKSISHRSLMLSGLAEGTSEVTGFLASEDCLATLHAMRALGVRIEQPGPTHVLIHGVGMRGLHGASHALDMGNAGTAMRLFTGLLAAQNFTSRLVGDSSLMKRPMERVANRCVKWARMCALNMARRPWTFRAVSGCTGSTTTCRWPAPR